MKTRREVYPSSCCTTKSWSNYLSSFFFTFLSVHNYGEIISAAQSKQTLSNQLKVFDEKTN
jgi:hypothetical protein